NAGTICRASQGECDLQEVCTGTSAICPPDAKSTALCRKSAGDCDVDDFCNGTDNVCPPDAFQPATVECRAKHDQCDVAEHCTGSSALCPDDAPAPDGTGCNDNDLCTQTDTCVAGQCVGKNPVLCGVLDQCHTL